MTKSPVKNLDKKIPDVVREVLEKLQKADFEAYIVGGCVRDLLLEKAPKDWDVTTDATPEEIQKIFPDSFYENKFGTVGVKTRSEDESLKVVEVTPYRIESKYSDSRHPDEVKFSKKLEDDLSRRDFTINALAYSKRNGEGEIVDLYEGEKDLKNKTIRSVGDAEKRFEEDALRILRAIRIATELNFSIETETMEAIIKNGPQLEKISRERIRDEFTKLILSPNPMVGMIMLEKMALLSHISPIFKEMIGVKQNKEAHKYDVWEHSLRSLQHAADKDYPFEIRLAALMHDISKPETKRTAGSRTTFFGHEVLGAKKAEKILKDLKYSKEITSKVTKLVRWHMFFADPDQITLSAVRRIITKVGKENIWDLMNLRICDRIGTGRPKEQPYRLRKYKSMVDEALRDPLSVGMLKIDGNILMKKTNIKKGPKIGFILHALLEEVLDDPKKNDKDHLIARAVELNKLPMSKLESIGKKGKERLEKEDEDLVKGIRKKHYVK